MEYAGRFKATRVLEQIQGDLHRSPASKFDLNNDKPEGSEFYPSGSTLSKILYCWGRAILCCSVCIVISHPREGDGDSISVRK